MRKLLLAVMIVLAAGAGFFLWSSTATDNDTPSIPGSANDNQHSSITGDNAGSGLNLAAELPAARWELVTVNTNNQQLQLAANYSQPLMLEFDPRENRIRGFGGCNTFSGPYSAARDYTVSFGPLAATKRGCEHLQLETTIFQAMQSAASWGVKGNNLVLTGADGNTDLIYRPAK